MILVHLNPGTALEVRVEAIDNHPDVVAVFWVEGDEIRDGVIALSKVGALLLALAQVGPSCLSSVTRSPHWTTP